MAPRLLCAVAVLAALALRGDTARVAGVAQALSTAPAAPAWPAAYEMEYTLTLPYVQTVQPGGLRYPVHVWWDGPGQRFRMDVYGGMDSTGWDNGQGIGWNLYPRISDLACDFSNGTVGPTAASANGNGNGAAAGALAAVRALLGDGASATPLPGISGWAYAGTANVGNAEAHVWQTSSRHGEKTSQYTFFTAPNGWPLRFYMMGLNAITGSHFDEYLIDFSRFKPGAPKASLFALPPACVDAGAGAAAGSSGGGAGGAGLAAALSTLLPGVWMGTGGAPSTALAANAALVAEHNRRNRAAAAAAANGAQPSTAGPQPRYSLSLNHFAQLPHDAWAATRLGLAPPSQRAAALRAASSSSSSTSSSSSSAVQQQPGRLQRVPFVRRLRDEQLPASVDWRGTGADGPGVKDQASCGSCWAFSAVGAMQGAWFKATGQPLSLSEQQLVDCSWEYGNNGCGGGWVEPAVQYAAELGGMAQESDYPYMGQNAFCRGPGASSSSRASASASASAPPAATFSGLANVAPRDEAALMEAVATAGPVAVVLNAALPPFKFYAEGVYHNEACRTDPDGMDHAVLLVGYGTTPEGVDYWLIKNSWSKYWGMDGYARITRKGNDCGITTDPVVVLVNATAAAEAAAVRRARAGALGVAAALRGGVAAAAAE